MLPEKEASIYLYVNIEALDQSKVVTRVRSFAVPLKVGNGELAMKQNGKVIQDGDELIIEMTVEQR